MLKDSSQLNHTPSGGDMNRDEILDALPSEGEFRAAPNYGKKDIVENLVRAILDQLSADRRDPDHWEADHIAVAFGHLLSDRYFAASTAAVKAHAPSEERADPESWVRTEDTATTGALRDALDFVAGKPARNGGVHSDSPLRAVQHGWLGHSLNRATLTGRLAISITNISTFRRV